MKVVLIEIGLKSGTRNSGKLAELEKDQLKNANKRETLNSIKYYLFVAKYRKGC